jgi:hypothetical protein
MSTAPDVPDEQPQSTVDFLVRPAARVAASAGVWLRSVDELRGHIRAALNGPVDVALFEVRGGGPSAAIAAVRVRVELDGVSLLRLHSHVLSGDFDLALERQLEELPGSVVCGTTLVADRTDFVESFETHAAASSLTSHQQQKLAECDGHADIHLAAPAGAGKTMIAIQRVLQALDSAPAATVIFVARNTALCFFVARQVARHFRGARRRSSLRRLHLLHEPLDTASVQRAAIRDGSRLALLPLRPSAGGDEEDRLYSLVVVDEAHHVFGAPAARRRVERLNFSKRLLLSDISQSRGRAVAYPPGLWEVSLSEVVRCSKRIVAGAMAFALGGEEKMLTRCHHDTTGESISNRILYSFCRATC